MWPASSACRATWSPHSKAALALHHLHCLCTLLDCSPPAAGLLWRAIVAGTRPGAPTSSRHASLASLPGMMHLGLCAVRRAGCPADPSAHTAHRRRPPAAGAPAWLASPRLQRHGGRRARAHARLGAQRGEGPGGAGRRQKRRASRRVSPASIQAPPASRSSPAHVPHSRAPLACPPLDRPSMRGGSRGMVSCRQTALDARAGKGGGRAVRAAPPRRLACRALAHPPAPRSCLPFCSDDRGADRVGGRPAVRVSLAASGPDPSSTE